MQNGVKRVELGYSEIEYYENDITNIVEISVDGKITKEGYMECIEPMIKFIERNGKVKILEEIKSCDGFEMSVLWEGIKFDFNHLKDFSHCAIVTDTGWIGVMARVANLIPSCEVRLFPLSEKEEARKWLINSDN